jgi:hypothetical protein
VVAGAFSGMHIIAVRSYLYPGAFFNAIPLVIVFGLELDGIEGNRDVLLVHSKEATDANDKHGDLAVAVDEHIHDFADFGIGRVIDALLVPMRNGTSSPHAISFYRRFRRAAFYLKLI